MIHKVAGYQGFNSYGGLPYASLKPGRTVLAPNDIWESSTRVKDQTSIYDNHSNLKSVYKTQAETVNPGDYQNHQHVKLGQNSSLTSTAKNVLTSTQDFSNQDPNQLKTGVEHWKSNYKANIQDRYANSKAQRPEWTLHKPAYEVDSKLGPSEYKTSFGEFGTKPTDKIQMNNDSAGQFTNSLKMGSTQITNHIPSYTGFIPQSLSANIALQQAKAENRREDKSRLSIIDQFHTKVPGYAGYQPKAPQNQRGSMREFCFSTESQIKI